MKKIEFQIEIMGLGIIFYSPHAVKHIQIGSRYLIEHYNKPQDVVSHIYEGSIVGFCTGSSGIYNINIYENTYPEIEKINPDYALKLCIQVTENIVYFRDLYVLLRWEKEDENDLKINIENGFYEVVVCSWLPESSIRGDNQLIEIYFIKKEKLPQLYYLGVPFLGSYED